MHKVSLLVCLVLIAFTFSEEIQPDSTKVDTVYIAKRVPRKKNKRTKRNYWEVTSKKYKRYVGVTGDISLAPGLSMKRWGNEYGLMLNVLPFYYEENYDSSGSYTDWEYRYDGHDKTGILLAGGAFLRKLNEGRMHRLYHYIGGHYYTYYDNEDYREDYNSWKDDSLVNNYSWTHEVGLGTGVGVEVWSRKLAVDFRAGLVGAYEVTENSKKILPSVGFGIYYRYDRKKHQ